MHEKMKIKEWKDYSISEKNRLLHHWWYYYGKLIITLEEQQKFNELVDKDSDQVFALAVASYVHGESSQPLIYAMRANKVEALMATIQKTESIIDEKVKNTFSLAENKLIIEIVRTYNNPQPSIPMSDNIIVEQIKGIEKAKRRNKNN